MTTLTRPSPVRADTPRRTRLLSLPEARWATAATVLFLLALPLQLTGAPTWTWAPLYAACYLTGGWEPALEGLRALRDKTLDVDLLMIVAAIGAAAIGEVTDGALLVVIFATSGALEAVATARTQDSVRGLLDLAPVRATRVTADGREEVVPADELVIGDVILVRPGERLGADGVIIDGVTEIDQAGITGEPLPVNKQAGDQVFAGTLNGTGSVRVRVEADASHSVIARIVAMVQEASRTKAPTQLFVERIEQRYSVGMVIATLLVLVVPLLFGAPFHDALLRAMTFMIVASPCAIVLATMPPLLSAIANAGRHGVLVKSAVVMERLGDIDTVALDKTGTITRGAPEVVTIRPLPGDSDGAQPDGTWLDENGLLALAAGVEHASEHPLGRAVVAAALDRGLTPVPVTEFASTPGRGVRALVDGAVIEIGAPSRLPGDDRPAAVTDLITELEEAGTTTLLVTRDGSPLGVLGLADQVRADATEAVTALGSLAGRTPLLLTGDNAHTAQQVAGSVGIDEIHAGLLPQDKAEQVRALQDTGRRVLLVGDGVNDAPALAVAHAGIAMGRSGSDLALETADAVVVRDELHAIPAVVALSRRARRLVVQNLCLAAAFIGVLVTWNLVGTLPLPLGVLGHEGSTVLVGLNGLRLLREQEWTPGRDG